ncbi:ABC transporter ATP-binding protein [Spirochaeta isovalerica]|uniref:NitT/TauT family transport system ATP-binding protein n=1 Tax=Spirochaeta isovalerica TaxID=150 RepID=A0A841R7E7_9SPIO|nr:ABC transporter ATP-binding protein [Spirochaeta isovalerica]MBB6479775.1 NitT/TauT family transport system ATP-binding protein [Spirochaeta isovalerica]
MSILKAESLHFAYDLDKGKHPVLEELSLEIDDGEFLAIIGPSGCGKSTLLRLLSGFLRPGSGKISRKGRDVLRPDRAGQMIFQDFNQLFPWLTVEQNILFPQYRFLLPLKMKAVRSGDQSRLEGILEVTGLNSFRKYLPHQLSGGLKQRTALARSLFADPQILFLDEPFGSLDAPSRMELQNLLLRVWKEKKRTVLFVTHDISEALLLADRLLVFESRNRRFGLYDNPLPRPRDRHCDEFRKRKIELYSLIESD